MRYSLSFSFLKENKMGDLDDLERSDVSRITGHDEQYAAKVNSNRELGNVDTVNSDSADTIIDLTTSPVELKVSISRMTNRKYIWMEALDNNIKWGFSSGTQSFDIFKNQLLCFPIGDVSIYAKMSSGTGQIAFGEGA